MILPTNGGPVIRVLDMHWIPVVRVRIARGSVIPRTRDKTELPILVVIESHVTVHDIHRVSRFKSALSVNKDYPVYFDCRIMFVVPS